MEDIARYAVIDKTQKIDVIYEVHVVESSSSSIRSIKSMKTITQSFFYSDNLTFSDGEEFGYIGVNYEKPEEILFIYWDVSDARYNNGDQIGVTTSFKVVAVTGTRDEISPTQSPAPMETPTRIPEPVNPTSEF